MTTTRPRADGADLGTWSAVRRRGLGRFAGDVLLRFRSSDGTTHVRALAYQTMFVILSGFIGLIGLASVLDVEQLRGVALELSHSLMGGPSSRVIQQAVEQGSQSGGTAAVVGLGAAALSGMLAMAQIERSANRLVASDEDRPGVRRFAMALVLSITVGTLFFVAALVFAGGGALARGFGWSGSAETIWAIARWPLGVIAAAVAIFATFRFAPYRRLGAGRSVLAGTIVAVVLWAIFSGGLALYFSLRADSGSNPYGPLLAIIALLLWSMLTSLALHLGMSTTAELEEAPKPSDHVVRVPEAPPMREPVGGRSPRDG